MTSVSQRERLRLLGLRHGPHYTLASSTPPEPARPPVAVIKAGTCPFCYQPGHCVDDHPKVSSDVLDWQLAQFLAETGATLKEM